MQLKTKILIAAILLTGICVLFSAVLLKMNSRTDTLVYATACLVILLLAFAAAGGGYLLLRRRLFQRLEAVTAVAWKLLNDRKHACPEGNSDDAIGRLGCLLDEVAREMNRIRFSQGEETLAHQKTQNDLITCRGQLNVLVEKMEDVFWVFSRDWKQVFFVSPAYEKIWGRPCQELYTQPLSMLEAIVDEDRPGIEKLLERSAAESTDRLFLPAYRIEHPQEGIRWIEDHRFPVLENNIVTRVIGIAKDITARKKSEEACVSGEEKFLSLAESIPLAISILQEEKILYVNEGWEKMTGYRADEIAHLSMFDMVHPDMRAQVRSYSAARLRGEDVPDRYELKFTDKKGNTKWWDLTATRFHYQGEKAVLCMSVDITLRKQLEKQLRLAQKMEAIGTLASGIAHDFNNILAAIIGFAELSQEDAPEGSALEENLGEILVSALRAKELVQQILTFSRRGDQAKKPIQLSLLISEALKMLRATIPSTIEITSDIRSGAIVEGDPGQLHQVLTNLCANAAQAMAADGGRLEVGLHELFADAEFCTRHPALKPGLHVVLTVTDTGPGMPPDMLPRIFDPFFTTKPVNEGSGMGLAVVHGIVAGHGGSIHPYSEPGQGSSFKVLLPAVKKQPAGRLPKNKAALSTGSERLLVVDDEPQLVKMVQQTLTALGYDVITRTSSLEALELFRVRSKEIDLVITDMTMPGLNGKDLAARMMAIRSDIPIIIITGYSSKIDEEKAAEMGFRAYVIKPVTRQELAGTVRRVLDDVGK